MKLSATQQKVIDILKANDCYIQESRYHDFQQIVSNIEIVEPADKSGFVYKHYHLHYFKKPTLGVLLRLNAIKRIEGYLDRYCINGK